MSEPDLEEAAARWRGSGAPAELVRAAERLPAGTPPARVRELLGEPRLVSPAADGTESWLYVPSDPGQGQLEALFVTFAAEGGFLRLDRKPID